MPSAAPDANTTKSVILTTISAEIVVFRWNGVLEIAQKFVTKFDPKRAKQEEKSRKGAKEEQI